MYGLPAPTQRPASNLYPSIQSGAPSGNGENYYTGNAAPSDAYGRPQSHYGGGYQPMPQQPYAQYDKRTPTQAHEQYPPAQQPSQPYPNLASHNTGTAPAQQPPSTTYQQSSPQLQRQVSNQQYPPQQSYPPQAPPPSQTQRAPTSTTATTTPRNHRSHLCSAHRASPPNHRNNNNLPRPRHTPTLQLNKIPSPHLHKQLAHGKDRASLNSHPHRQPLSNNLSNSSSTGSNRQPQQQPQSQAWQPAPYAAGGYGPESFPSAPQNQLPVQQKVVDEPLIDL
jgi:growth factor-regulated tyrosine kinase substrate